MKGFGHSTCGVACWPWPGIPISVFLEILLGNRACWCSCPIMCRCITTQSRCLRGRSADSKHFGFRNMRDAQSPTRIKLFGLSCSDFGGAASKLSKCLKPTTADALRGFCLFPYPCVSREIVKSRQYIAAVPAILVVIVVLVLCRRRRGSTILH